MSNTVSHLLDLAGRINEAHELAESAMNDALGYAHEAGKLLIEAKPQIKHGEWLPWLADNFKGRPRTAQQYMQFAKRWPEIEAEAKAHGRAHFGIDDARALIAEPRPEPDEPELVEASKPELVEAEDVTPAAPTAPSPIADTASVPTSAPSPFVSETSAATESETTSDPDEKREVDFRGEVQFLSGQLQRLLENYEGTPLRDTHKHVVVNGLESIRRDALSLLKHYR